ncbi:MAG: BglG family transcription antiterminator LicT [Lachnospirales bacterium]
MFKITKIINNNIVSSEDKKGNEVILRGLGIGYRNHIGGIVSEDKIEKIYRVADKTELNKMQQLFDEIPVEYIDVCEEIIEFAESILGKKLNKNIRITLTDHIDFAIERTKKNLNYKNALLFETANFYPVEYGIGKRAVEIINERFNQNLSDDEAGFIALHIVNSELDTDMNNTFDITEMIQTVTEIINKHYKKEFDIHTMNYTRFIVHMKFFGQRLFKNKLFDDDDTVFQNLIKERYKDDYSCAVKIRSYISAKYNKVISEEELILITIHLRRISKNN